MPGKEQQALFRQALSLHERDSDEPSLRAALALYEQAKSAAPLTLPIAYNAGVLCLDLSQRSSSALEARDFRLAAARNLESALELGKDNLEAIVARAAVEDEFAKHAGDASAALEHRKEAIRLLERGTVAEPSDPSVRLSLVEALVQCAESLSEHHLAENAEIQNVLQSAEAPLLEAKWLIEAKLSDLTRMGTDANSVQQLQSMLNSAILSRAKVVLATVRLTSISKPVAVQELQQAIDSLRTPSFQTNFDGILTQAELLEALTEQDVHNIELLQEEAIRLCQNALEVPVTQFEAATEASRRKLAAATLLGDLCLGRLRSEKDKDKATTLIAEGTKAYEAVTKEEGSRSKSHIDSETWYNLACLLCVGMAKGCPTAYSEQDVARLLKSSVDAGGVSAQDLSNDTDLGHLRSRKWFGQLLDYASRKSR